MPLDEELTLLVLQLLKQATLRQSLTVNVHINDMPDALTNANICKHTYNTLTVQPGEPGLPGCHLDYTWITGCHLITNR